MVKNLDKKVKKGSKTQGKPVKKPDLVKSRQKHLSLKWLVILSYLIYLLFIILSQIPYVAEQFIDNTRADSEPIEYHITFEVDGRQSHYRVERVNQSLQGKIDVYYYANSNTLKTNVRNIKSLTIYCRSMYYDECKDALGVDPYKNSNYYKWFFIEKNHLNVNIESDSEMDTLKFIDAPKPAQVIVDNVIWSDPEQYEYIPSTGVALSNISIGITNVDIYFKSSTFEPPVAIIEPSKMILQISEPVNLDGSNSYDTSLNGYLSNYIWDFGDGNYTSGFSQVTHQYSEPGIYGIILTVVDDELNTGRAYANLTVISSGELQILGKVPDIQMKEDDATFELELNKYEPYSPGVDKYYWYITEKDDSLYAISGENSTDDTIYILPASNQFGDDEVILWLKDSEGNRVFQELWINITPINDPPTIFGIPDITLHYDVPYEFNYFLYIQDIDTPSNALQLNTSDPIYTKVRGFNVTYNYPKKMLDEIVYVILTVWDGKSESSDVTAVWITDDWVPNLVTPLPDVFLDEGEVYLNYFDLDDYFSDPDNDSLYYSYGYTHVNVVINQDHTVDFYAPNDWNGEELTTFRATDPSGALVEDIITVIVKPINDPPKIKNVPNLVIRYNQDYIFDVSPYIYDEDTPIEELVLTTSDTEHIRIEENYPLVIILNYPFRIDIPYTTTVTLTVSDGYNSSYQIITVFVKTNNPPIILKEFKEMVLIEDVPKLEALNLYDFFSDTDSSMMYFQIINNNKISIEINISGKIDIYSAPNWSGHETITIRALDSDLAFAEGVLEVRVLPINDPPTIRDIPVQEFNKSLKHKLDLHQYLYDVDNNITQLNIWIEDCKIEYVIHGTNIIFFATQPITTTATLHVSDGESEVSEKILLRVTGKSKTSRSFYIELLAVVLVVIIMIMGIIGFIYRNYKGDYEIVELFLIYSNGVMLVHQSNENINREETDADIISAMFTAVQDFTRDSFASSVSEDENWALKRMEFKNNNILIERGQYLYIAVVFTGKPGKKLKKHLREIRTKIEKTYELILGKWEGDLDQLKGVQDIIDQYRLIPHVRQNSTLEEQIVPHQQNIKLEQ
jgi:PKD repeat protein